MSAPRPAPGATLALAAAAAALLACHAVLAWLSPVVGDDWGHLMWRAGHADAHGLDLVRAFLATHFTVGDAGAYALVTTPLLHAVLTPLVSLALVAGLFVLAHGRLPRRGSWDDVLALVLLSALVWLAQPRAGLVVFYRTFAAAHLYGTTLGVWVTAAYVVRGRRGPGWLPLLFVGGALAGLASRQVAVATLIACVTLTLRAPRAERGPWMLAGLLGLLGGTIASLFDRPFISTTAFRRSFEGIAGLLNLPLREGGEVVSLVLLLVAVRLVLVAALGARAGASATTSPAPAGTARWLAIWGGLCVLALFGPRYSEATLLPATAALAVAALPWLRWLAELRLLRGVIVGLAIGTHLVAWGLGARALREVHADHEARLAALAATPPGEVARIAPYRYLNAGYWFFGEDWAGVTSRQLTGIQLFGVRDIEFAPPFRRLELNPRVAIRLVLEGLTPAEVAALDAPALWATEPANARMQFEGLIARARRQGVAARLRARLVADQPAFAGQDGRPLLVAWFEDGKLDAPRVRRKAPDVSSVQTIFLTAARVKTFTSAFLLADGQATPLTYTDGGYKFRVLLAGPLQVIGCEPTRCVLLDAFVPRL